MSPGDIKDRNPRGDSGERRKAPRVERDSLTEQDQKDHVADIRTKRDAEKEAEAKRRKEETEKR